MAIGLNMGLKSFLNTALGAYGPVGSGSGSGSGGSGKSLASNFGSVTGLETDTLEKKKMLRGRLTEAFNRNLSSEDLDKELGVLRGEAANLDVDPKAFEREVEEERGLLEAMNADKGRYEDFFARANDPNRTLGAGSRRRLYSPRARLKLAERLRKKGFVKAAERAAMQYADSPEAMAPAISTPQMRQQQMVDAQRASEIREMNRGLTQLLIARTAKDLRDPNFNLFG
jgi:hypothetical protein|tara:strand:- start:13598 stop:14281 length:684 start_codon:yes stop_codon:yes gene_type:complete